MGTITNGDFEDGSTGWELESYGEGSPQVVEVSTEQYHSGSHSLKLSAGTGACVWGTGTITNVSPFDTLSLYIYVSEYDDGVLEDCYIRVYERAEEGFEYIYDLESSLTTSGWQTIEINLAAQGLDHSVDDMGIQIHLNRVVPS